MLIYEGRRFIQSRFKSKGDRVGPLVWRPFQLAFILLVIPAIANAEDKGDSDVDKLYVKSVFVDQGPTMKRMRARAMGRSNMIRRRTSHITIVVDEK